MTHAPAVHGLCQHSFVPCHSFPEKFVSRHSESDFSISAVINICSFRKLIIYKSYRVHESLQKFSIPISAGISLDKSLFYMIFDNLQVIVLILPLLYQIHYSWIIEILPGISQSKWKRIATTGDCVSTMSFSVLNIFGYNRKLYATYHIGCHLQ